VVTPYLFAISSADLSVDAPPRDPSNCWVQVTATIGPSDAAGGDNFDFVVATPRAFELRGELCWGRGLLLMNEFSWDAVRRMLQRLLAHAVRPTWSEVAAELNKELLWEFDRCAEHKAKQSAV